MPTITSPGVYDREIDLSLYTPAVSSLVVGMVIAAKSGPLNKATLVTNPNSFIKIFGEPLTDHYGGLAAIQALAELDKLYIVRVASDQGADAVATSEVVINNGGGVASHTGSNTETFVIDVSNKELSFKINNEANSQLLTLEEDATASAQSIVDQINAGIQGVVASVSAGAIKIETKQDGPQAKLEIETSVSGSANTVLGFTPGSYVGTQSSAVAAEATSGAESFDTTGGNNVISVQVGANSPVQITLTDSATATAATLAGEINAAGGGAADSETGFTASDNAGTVVITAQVTADGEAPDLTFVGGAATVLGIAGTTTGTDAESLPSLTVKGLYAGSTSNNYSVVVTRDQYENTFKLEIYNQGVLVDTFRNLNKNIVDEDNYVEESVNPSQDFIEIDDNALNGAIPASGTYQLAGGADGLSQLTDSDYIGVASDPAGKPTGLQIFTNVDEFDILTLICVPGISSTPVIQELISICEKRGDVMTLIDPPVGLSVQDVGRWMDGRDFGNNVSINSNYAATYWSWIESLDTYSNTTMLTPPSGHLLRVYAYNDRVGEQWYAPAGYNRGIIRGRVTDLEPQGSPDQGSRDILFGTPARINPIVKTREGIVVLGDKTSTTKPSALDAIGVRRMLIAIKKSFRLSTKFLLFEPNDPATADTLVRITKPFLGDVASRRGLSDFDVVADESINTGEVKNRKELHANVFLKPILAVRAIQLNYVVTRQDAVFSELEV
jgi:phage tail sheath protein FI